MTEINKSKLTLGPLFYHWPAEKRRDFYFRIADEAPVDCVYLGEVVCSKRVKFYSDDLPLIIERLIKAGKQVIMSSLALLTLPREMQALEELAGGELLVEANDVAALTALDGKPFVAGPFINVMNEGAFDVMAAQGASRIVFASELNGRSIGLMAGRAQGLETEVQVFGKQPLAVSMRCYHARAHGRDKDHCKIVCGEDPDGMEAATIEGHSILTVNGTQTLSDGYVVLADEVKEMASSGVTHFRLAPHDMDMVCVASLYRDFLDKKIEASSLLASVKELKSDLLPINGFYHGAEGKKFIEN